MDLFAYNLHNTKPLADELRPSLLSDFIGQDHIIGPGKPLLSLIEQGKIPSLILWGPPGVGKTTLARIIAKHTRHHFITLSAVTSGIKEVKEVMTAAKESLKLHDQMTILFIDEIHRFNKAQQDAFLPFVEDGTITLIGATTENPSFEVISALLSRCQVVVLKPLSLQALKQILQRALTLKDKGHFLTEAAMTVLIDNAHADARYLLNMLADLFVLFPQKDNLDAEEIARTLNKRALLYDKKAEHHYNVISAFIKSMRGSDPDAAVYYLARLLEAGEEPLFVARRMVIFASEDIGNANPQAVQVAVACMQSFDFVGTAEGWIPLAHCAVYLASSPKSNASYAAYQAALADVKKFGPLEVPLHLRSAPTELMKGLGYGQGYRYAHDFEGNKVAQQHLPDELKTRRYYTPTNNGYEAKVKEWLGKK